MDHLDIGAITVLTGDDMISVPCIDQTMRGKSLEWWMTEQGFRKAEASADVATHAAANREARQTWQGEVNAIASSAGVNLVGRSPDEIERLARAMRFGKGAHEQPFVSEAEDVDPLQIGFPIGSERDRADGDGFRAAAVVSEDKSQIADNNGELDKFRAKARHRARMKSNGEDGA